MRTLEERGRGSARFPSPSLRVSHTFPGKDKPPPHRDIRIHEFSHNLQGAGLSEDIGLRSGRQ